MTLLIPVFESATYVGDAINAALSQTYGHIEIIIAPDDGDTYSQLRERFTTPQLRIIPPGVTRKTGAGPTRNRAINASTGEYFAMLDADDLIPPTYIEDLMKVALIEGAAIAPTRYTRWDVSEVVRVLPMHKAHLSLSGFAQLLASMHPLIHRSLETGYCAGFAEDVLHDGIAIARLGTIRVVDSVWYSGRVRTGSECNNGSNVEREIQAAYRYRIEQVLQRPTELGMQMLNREDRKDFVDLFRFRAFVSTAFSKSGAECYNTWVAGKEAALWDQFSIAKRQAVLLS
ncbi:MAG TPA: glycosyltransferase family 2 protein [Noviherbaspirillum sp.]|uniref:glycosyltransferase family 2 protein n=1 Tax=Noviherbaspirillum sp. TaxID=1926288 RepID=UPI002B489C51|nr:glycosyltransferase family 2 protein [Noviherbaspirillum sp.]HJV85393.1 glycosyltransferase family 2 protein [Noviherbaspirillum sp.]